MIHLFYLFFSVHLAFFPFSGGIVILACLLLELTIKKTSERFSQANGHLIIALLRFLGRWWRSGFMRRSCFCEIFSGTPFLKGNYPGNEPFENVWNLKWKLVDFRFQALLSDKLCDHSNDRSIWIDRHGVMNWARNGCAYPYINPTRCRDLIVFQSMIKGCSATVHPQ